MCRPMPSGVSALRGFVANGRQAVHHVSSSLSEIPYGGFSPVRLQTGRRRQPSPSRAYMPPKLLQFSLTVAPLGQSPNNVDVEARAVQAQPIQRPLARRRVILSRRVNAYYGLIRASGPLLSAYDFRRTGLCLSAAGQKVPALICESFESCRHPYPGGPDGARRLNVHP